MPMITQKINNYWSIYDMDERVCVSQTNPTRTLVIPFNSTPFGYMQPTHLVPSYMQIHIQKNNVLHIMIYSIQRNRTI